MNQMHNFVVSAWPARGLGMLSRNKIIESSLQQKQTALTAEAQRTQRFAEIFSCLVLLRALCASAVNDFRLWCLCMTT